MNINLESVLSEVINVCADASQTIMEIYNSEKNIAIYKKSDQSPVTEADLIASHMLCEKLNNIINIPVISEENDFNKLKDTNSFWLIDPIDGTKSFIKKNGLFTVNIALFINLELVLGVVAVPLEASFYYAAKDVGSFYQDQYGIVRNIKTSAINKEIKVVSSTTTKKSLVNKFMQDKSFTLDSLSSSVKICLVADGSYDLYPRFSDTSVWDIAAAHCILEIAGGDILYMDGKKLEYNLKKNILNPAFIAIGDPKYYLENFLNNS